jgi:hypothetical protein
VKTASFRIPKVLKAKYIVKINKAKPTKSIAYAKYIFGASVNLSKALKPNVIMIGVAINRKTKIPNLINPLLNKFKSVLIFYNFE